MTMRNWKVFSRRVRRIVFSKSFSRGFWGGWAELLVLDPYEPEPTFRRQVLPNEMEALRGDAERLAGDFRRAMQAADRVISEKACAK